ncbi:MAG: site-specific DNA-methyltransferase [candidate division Zixibacteria bacterium]|nr:site-specific DNA-methyltransferase [Candidatus Tariuqbacter arcticus]
MQKNIIYYKDARNLKEVEDNSITLIITSPPYWNIKDYSMDGYQSQQKNDPVKGQIGDIKDYLKYLKALTVVWKECERILKPNGKLCINTPLMPVLKRNLNTHYTRDIFNISSGIEYEILNETGLFLLDIYIWNRTNPTKKLMFGSYPYPPNFYAQNTIEFINVYIKDGEPVKKSQQIKEASKLTEKEWVEFTKQIWNIPIPNVSDEAYGEHPAIMPLEIPQRLIKLYSFVGDIIFDPFMGSGTTAKAAIELNRFYTGYEINPNYKKIIDAKLSNQSFLPQLII